MKSSSKKIYEFGSFQLDSAEHTLSQDGNVISLTPKVFDTLMVLVENNGHLVEKDELLEKVWADAIVEESNLTKNISILRKVLSHNGLENPIIETVPKLGYRFVAPVCEINIENTKTDKKTQKNVRFFLTKTKTALIAAVVLLVLTAGFGYWFFGNFGKTARTFQPGQVLRLTMSGRVTDAAISPKGEFIVYAQEEDAEQQSLWIKHVGSESGVPIVPAADTKYRGLQISRDSKYLYYFDARMILYRMPVLGGAPEKVLDKSNTNISISPDGSRIAYIRRFGKEKTTLFLASSDGTDEQKLVSFEQPLRLLRNLAWSPDGKTIACHSIDGWRQNIFAIDSFSGKFIQLFPHGWSEIGSIRWMPDSKSLLIYGRKLKEKTNAIWHISYPGGESKQITERQYAVRYPALDLSADGNSLIALKTEKSSYIWTMPANGDSNLARQITAGAEKYDGPGLLDWTPDGKIAYFSRISGVATGWIMNADGSFPRMLAKEAEFHALSPDGRYAVLSKASPGLWRLDLTDGSEKHLTDVADVYTTFSPDGRWLVFTRFSKNERIGLYKLPVEGGKPEQVLDEIGTNPGVSPDGKTVAFVLRNKGSKIALVPFDGGKISRIFDAKVEFNVATLRWSKDGRSIYYIALDNNVSNIWRQPIGGSPPVQVTDFKDGRIFNFAFSADGKHLALSRGSINSDVFLIQNLE